MDVILVPGLWLDASSWDGVITELEKAGHIPHPLSMPGTGAAASESSQLSIDDWVAAVVAEIDAVSGPVALVGHSGGGNVVWGAADARPDRVARVVFVDAVPPADGHGISEFEVVDGVIPFPGWQIFDEPDIFDLDDETRAHIVGVARSVPAQVPTAPLRLRDDHRHHVPVTILSGQQSAESLVEQLSEWPEFAAEFAAIHDTEVITLDSGHWPQFSQPEAFATALAASIR